MRNKRMLISIVGLLILGLCTCQSDNVSKFQVLNARLSDDLQYAAIDLLCIGDPDTSVVKEKSREIRNQYSEYKNVYVYFYNDGEDKSSGAWSVSSFDPNFRFSLFEKSKEDIEINLPLIDIEVDTSDKDSPYLNLYLVRNVSSNHVSLMYDHKSTSYSELEGILELAKSRFSKWQRPRIVLRIHIERDIPYMYLNYLESYLAGHRQLRIQYVYNKGGHLCYRRLEPYSLHCELGERSSIISEVESENRLFTEEEIALIDGNLNPIWNPRKYACKYESVVRQEDLHQFRVDSTGQVYSESVQLTKEEIENVFSDLIEDMPNTNRLFIVLSVSPKAKYEDFLNLYLRIRNAFNQKRESYAQDNYGKTLSECDRTIMKRILSTYPLGLSIEVN